MSSLSLSEKFKSSHDGPLVGQEASNAIEALHKPVNDKFFQKIDRSYVDPILPGQLFCLHSFEPADGAKPNKNGFYGMFKIRGCFASEEESDSRAEFLIKNSDSVHSIYTGRVGRPMPICDDDVADKYTADPDAYAEKTNKELQVRTQATDEEKKMAKDQIEDRKQLLLLECADDYKKPEMTRYIELRNQYAQLVHLIFDTTKKLEEYKGVCAKAKKAVKKMENKNPELFKSFSDIYHKSREEVGLTNDPTVNPHLNYMNDIIEGDENEEGQE